MNTEYKEGDLIEATKGEAVIRGRIKAGAYGFELLVEDTGWYGSALRDQGFAIEVIERAPEPLPTEPGVYGSELGDIWTLHRNGDWFHNGDGSYAVKYSENEIHELHSHVRPSARLRPEPEVTAEVVESVAAWFDTVRTIGNSTIANRIREKFGVTS